MFDRQGGVPPPGVAWRRGSHFGLGPGGAAGGAWPLRGWAVLAGPVGLWPGVLVPGTGRVGPNPFMCSE